MYVLEIPFPNLQKQIMRSSNIEEHFQTKTKDKRKKAKNRPVLENAFVLQSLPI